MDEKHALTTNQKRFCEEYLIDRNAVQAYFRAFGRTTARGTRRSYFVAAEQARRLLQKPEIRAEVEAGLRELARRAKVNAARWVRELAAIAFFDPAEVFDRDPQGGPLVARPLHDIPPAARRVIAAVKVKRRRLAGGGDELYQVEEVEYRFLDKHAALEKLGKHLGLLKDKLQVGGDPDAPPVKHEHGGTVNHQLGPDPEAFRSFMATVLATGVPPVPGDGDGERVGPG